MIQHDERLAAVGSLLALAVGLVERLGLLACTGVWETGIGALIGNDLNRWRCAVLSSCERRAASAPAGGGLPTGHGCKTSMRRQSQAQSTSCSMRATADSSYAAPKRVEMAVSQ